MAIFWYLTRNRSTALSLSFKSYGAFTFLKLMRCHLAVCQLQVWKLTRSYKIYHPFLKICARNGSSQDGHCGTYQVRNSTRFTKVQSMIIPRSGTPSTFAASRRLFVFGRISQPNVELLELEVLNKGITCIDSCATAEWRTVGNSWIYRPISHAYYNQKNVLKPRWPFPLDGT